MSYHSDRVLAVFLISLCLFCYHVLSYVVFIPTMTLKDGPVISSKAYITQYCAQDDEDSDSGSNCQKKDGSVAHFIIFDIIPMIILLATLILALLAMNASTPQDLQAILVPLGGAQKIMGYVAFGALMVFVNDIFTVNELKIKYTWNIGMYLGVAYITGSMFLASLRIAPSVSAPVTGIPTPGHPASTPTFTCPGCSRPLPGDARFCPQCGKTLVTQCPVCKKPCTPESKFCEHCGEALS